MAEITSLQNPFIKRVRSLAYRKYRRKEGCFWAEGIRIVMEALALQRRVEALVWAPGLLRSEVAQQAVQSANVDTIRVSERVFRGLSGRENPQGLGAVIRIPETGLADLQVAEETFLVVLEEPQDPGNVGSVLRTVDCAGGSGVVLLGQAADPYDPQAVRASMGSLFALPVVTGVEAGTFVNWARSGGVHLVGTSAGARTGFRDASYPRPLALVFGSEQKGLSQPLREAGGRMVRIPMRGRASSLNLASAVAVMVFQAVDA